MSEHNTIEVKETYLIPGGIPVSEAKRLKRKLQLAITAMNKELEQLKFYSEVENSGERQTISSGLTEKEMLNIPNRVEIIALTCALKTYIEDALKAYTQVRKSNWEFSLEDYCREKGIEMPQKPKMVPVLTEDDYYGSLSVEETCRLLTLEASAATIGKLIHPQGRFASEREKVIDCSSNPISVNGTGKDILITETTAGVDIEKIDKMFYHLQDLHREAQKKINTLKYDCQKAIAEEMAQNEKESDLRWKEYDKQYQAVYSEYLKFREQEERRINELGVAIPKMLQGIYERWA